jgi:hypothetical protein
MTKYIVYATMSVDLKCEIEIDDDQDPWEVAKNIDGGDFTEIPYSGDWKIYDIEGA